MDMQMTESDASIQCAACGCAAPAGTENCPLCGASLADAKPMHTALSPAERVRVVWADKRARIAVILVGALAVCGIVAVTVSALMQDAALKENARTVAEGETQLVQGTPSAQAGTSTLETGSEWLFATAEGLFMAQNQANGGWILQRSVDGGETWSVALSGSGRLMTACMAGDKLFYSLDDGGSASSLRSQTMSGAFSEYASATDIAAVSATEEMVVTKSVAGKLGWLNIGSGIWHDLHELVDAAVGQSNTRVADVRAFGTQAIASTDTGQIVLVDVNKSTAFIAGQQEG